MTEQRDKARQAVFITALVLAALIGSGYGQQTLRHKTIHESTRAGDTADVKEHLRRGTDVDAKDNDGSTPLLLAARGGHTETARLLLDKDADVNARNNNGSTPLHAAVFMGRDEIAELLQQRGGRE